MPISAEQWCMSVLLTPHDPSSCKWPGNLRASGTGGKYFNRVTAMMCKGIGIVGATGARAPVSLQQVVVKC